MTDAAAVVASIPLIKPSIRDTCETQKKIAEQTSAIETIKRGKEVVYKARPCKDPVPASQPPSTS